MPTFSATAVFISPDGLLLTNNHVLGVSICPVEGCYVQLTFGDQRGVPVSPAEVVFAVPKAVNVGLDVAGSFGSLLNDFDLGDLRDFGGIGVSDFNIGDLGVGDRFGPLRCRCAALGFEQSR